MIKTELMRLEKMGKIEIIENLKFKVLKNNTIFEYIENNKNEICECGNSTKYISREYISDNYYMEIEICENCILFGLNNFEECGFED